LKPKNKTYFEKQNQPCLQVNLFQIPCSDLNQLWIFTLRETFSTSIWQPSKSLSSARTPSATLMRPTGLSTQASKIGIFNIFVKNLSINIDYK
jgi:hypothetical protein